MNGFLRPSVSVVIPFAGSQQDAERLVRSLEGLQLRRGDEVIVADNRLEPTRPGSAAESVTWVAAPEQASSYYARNCGALVAKNDWLLFLDADTVPPPDLLNASFPRQWDADVGAVAGQVRAPRAESLAERYAESRGFLRQDQAVADPAGAYGATAHLLVRASAFHLVGGFAESIISGGDRYFCLCLRERGWRIIFNAAASVDHPHRSTWRQLFRQVRRYAAGSAWLTRTTRTSERSALTHAAALGRGASRFVYYAIRGDLSHATFALFDLWVAASPLTVAVRGNRCATRVSSCAPAAEADGAFTPGSKRRIISLRQRAGGDIRNQRDRVYWSDDYTLVQRVVSGAILAATPIATKRLVASNLTLDELRRAAAATVDAARGGRRHPVQEIGFDAPSGDGRHHGLR